MVNVLLEAFATGRTDDLLAVLSDDVVIVIPPSVSAEPDVYEGHAGARHYIAGFDGLMDDVRFEADEILEEDGRVLVVMQLAGRGVRSGIDLGQPAVAVIEVRDGKIARIEAHPDLESARRAH